MEELVKQVASKVGISEDQAQAAVRMVVEHLKERLPGPIAGQIDGVLGGGLSDLGDAAKGLGGLFGRD